jgi:choline dehydrogenase-like flavoprotein
MRGIPGSRCSQARSSHSKDLPDSPRRNLKASDLENFIRHAATPYSHEPCPPGWGHDSMSVVDNRLRVYGIEKLWIASGSIMRTAFSTS